MNKLALIMIWLAVLLAGCGGSLRGDASAGPNPGGGFYGAPNIDIGRINPREHRLRAGAPGSRASPSGTYAGRRQLTEHGKRGVQRAGFALGVSSRGS
jgi:hypothetical protein